MRYGDLSVLGSLFVTIRQSKNPCSIADISFGQTVNGQVSKSDCYIAGLPGMYQKDYESKYRYVDVYHFDGAAGQPISISMNSSAVDSYLVLQGPYSPYYTKATGDDYRGTLSARIPATGNFLLPATGRYAILATTAPKAGSSKTGAYSLTLTTTCTYSLSGTGAAVWAFRSTGSINVTTAGSCGWVAKSNVDWITIADYMDIFATAGNGTVTYTVAPNPNSVGRSGTIIVAGQTFTVNQQGAN